MGGIVRLVRQLPVVNKIAKTAPIVKLAPQIVTDSIDKLKSKKEAETQKAAAMASTKKATFGGTSQQTILTSSQGVEDEANVAKTVLGGSASLKKPTTNNFGY